LRWSILLLLFISLLPLQVSAAKVRVGIDNNPPLTFVDDQGRADGLFPELLQEIADKKQWQLQVVPCKWQQCLELLEQGDIDMLPAIAYTEARAKKYRYAEETVFTSWGQVYQRADDDSVDSILQLDGKRLAVLGKDVYYQSDQGLLQVAEKFDIKINYVEVASYAEAFELLAAGDVDAAMVGRIFGIKQRQKYDLRPAPILIKPIQVRPAFSPAAAPLLIEQFDQTLADWKGSTTSIYYQDIQVWLRNRQSKFQIFKAQRQDRYS